MFQVFPNAFKLCLFLSGFKIIIINWGDSCECRKDSALHLYSTWRVCLNTWYTAMILSLKTESAFIWLRGGLSDTKQTRIHFRTSPHRKSEGNKPPREKIIWQTGRNILFSPLDGRGPVRRMLKQSHATHGDKAAQARDTLIFYGEYSSWLKTM